MKSPWNPMKSPLIQLDKLSNGSRRKIKSSPRGSTLGSPNAFSKKRHLSAFTLCGTRLGAMGTQWKNGWQNGCVYIYIHIYIYIHTYIRTVDMKTQDIWNINSCTKYVCLENMFWIWPHWLNQGTVTSTLAILRASRLQKCLDEKLVDTPLQVRSSSKLGPKTQGFSMFSHEASATLDDLAVPHAKKLCWTTICGESFWTPKVNHSEAPKSVPQHCFRQERPERRIPGMAKITRVCFLNGTPHTNMWKSVINKFR